MVIEYTPHAAQMEIHRARGHRFRTVCTGRRFGKTLCMAAELLDRGGGEAGGDYAWVAPTYGVAERGVEAFKTIAPEFARITGRMPARAEFEGAAGPCRVWFLSADNPDSIRGFGFLFVNKWRGRLVMDATGVGDPVFDDLRRELPDAEGFRITAQSKRELVQGLMVAVEQRRVSWPGVSVGSGSGQSAVGDWEVLTAEMRRYEYAAGPSGQVTYSAPSGYHDDCVMALALAVWGCRAAGVEPGRMVRLPEAGRGRGRRAAGDRRTVALV